MNPITWFLLEFIFAMITTVLTYFLVRSFLQRKKVEINLLNSTVMAVVLVIKFLTSSYFNDSVIIISSVSIITAFIIGWFYFQSKLARTIMSAMFVFLSGAISELLAGVLIMGFRPVSMGEAMQFGIYRILIRTLSCLFLLIIIILLGRLRKSLMTSMSTKLVLSLCILPLVSILIVQQFTLHVVDTTYTTTINEIIPMISIIIVNIFIFILVETIIWQNEKSKELILIEAQSIAQQKHILQLIDNHEHIRQISHDFKQQVDVLYRLCNEKHYDELLYNLSKLSKHHNSLLIVKTGNLMLDTILSSKKEDAVKQGVEFELKLNVQPMLHYITMDICILLGNAIDNAIEACARSHSNKKSIEMELTADSSRFLFHMKNNIGELPQKEGEFLKTQKADTLRHGIGLQSIKQICKRLDGDMTYEYDNMKFAIWIYLPIN